jgi:hypothetical protein
MSVLELNLGTADRFLRVVLGLALLACLLVIGPSAWWGWLGLVPLVTGIAGVCPLYSALGVSTLRHGGAGMHPTA